MSKKKPPDYDYPHGRRGFASDKFPKDKQKRIARIAGIIAHRKGVAHKWTSEEAKVAGRIGGKNSWKKTKRIKPA